MYDELTSYPSLERAFRRARRGKRGRREQATFFFDYELRLLELERELRERRYIPDPYRYFQIRTPKVRTISVATFRDRVVHHALVAGLEPIFEQSFHRHSYACRPDKGTHRAVLWCRHYARRFPYFLKMDVERYFDHVDHRILLDLIEARIRAPDVLWLCGTILEHARVPTGPRAGTGIPIGNLTSQFLGNVYLDPLDVMLSETRPGRIHLRYMDDLLVFGHSKRELWSAHERSRALLAERLSLDLKERVTLVAPTSEGIPFLGCRVFPNLLRVDRAGLVRFTRRTRAALRAHMRGALGEEELAGILAGLHGHLATADSARFRRDFLERLEGQGLVRQTPEPWDEVATARTA